MFIELYDISFLKLIESWKIKNIQFNGVECIVELKYDHDIYIGNLEPIFKLRECFFKEYCIGKLISY